MRTKSEAKVDRSIVVHAAPFWAALRCLTLRFRTVVLLVPVASRVRVWHDSFSPLDNRFLHAHRPMNTVQLVVETASITYSMPALIPPPEWRCRGPAVLTGYDNRGVLVLDLQSRNVDRSRGVVHPLIALLASGTATLTLLLGVELRRLRDSVVVGGASTTSFGTACTIALSTTRARAGRHPLLGDIGRCWPPWILGSGTWSRGDLGWRGSRVGGHELGRLLLQGRRARGVPCLLIQAASVADSGTLGRSPPQRGLRRSTVAADLANMALRRGRGSRRCGACADASPSLRGRRSSHF